MLTLQFCLNIFFFRTTGPFNQTKHKVYLSNWESRLFKQRAKSFNKEGKESQESFIGIKNNFVNRPTVIPLPLCCLSRLHFSRTCANPHKHETLIKKKYVSENIPFFLSLTTVAPVLNKYQWIIRRKVFIKLKT